MYNAHSYLKSCFLLVCNSFIEYRLKENLFMQDADPDLYKGKSFILGKIRIYGNFNPLYIFIYFSTPENLSFFHQEFTFHDFL